MEELFRELVLQLEYVNGKLPMGTTNAVLARANAYMTTGSTNTPQEAIEAALADVPAHIVPVYDRSKNSWALFNRETQSALAATYAPTMIDAIRGYETAYMEK